MNGAATAYQDRLRAECDTFAGQQSVHGDLPPAFHYWSARHVLPKLQALGVASLDDFFVEPVLRRAAGISDTAGGTGGTGGAEGTVVVLSVGSGNGDQELDWLARVRNAGAHNVRLHLLEINPAMQRRAAAEAERRGLADQVKLLTEDFNSWRAGEEYDVVIANQALHHVTALEHLYREIRGSLRPDGVLLVSDIIGRNGHRRWPEALEVVERLWAALPPRLRRNAITGRVDEVFPDEDCSAVGFEGVRAQDVLPLLLGEFHPELFLAFANVVDPFVDRIYGGNFDLGRPADRRLLEHVGELDDALIDTGLLAPTHLIAAFRTVPVPVRYHGGRSPDRCVRDPRLFDPAGRVSFSPAATDPRRLVTGSMLPAGRLNGLMHDGWVGQLLEVPVFTAGPVRAVHVELYVPEHFPVGSLELSVDGVVLGAAEVRHGCGRYTFPADLPARQAAMVSLRATWSAVPRSAGWGEDVRQLAFVLQAISAGDEPPASG